MEQNPLTLCHFKEGVDGLSDKMQSPEWLGIFAGILGLVNKTSLETFWQTQV